MSNSIDLQLHDKQAQIFTALHNRQVQFAVVPAGRRGGKSYLAAALLIAEALKLVDDFGNDLRLKEVWFIAPSLDQAKVIMWKMLLQMAQPVISKALSQTGVVHLKNGRTICLKGSDNPDSLVGVGLSFVVLDEYSIQKPQTWEISVQPTLADVDGKALFIGTPRGRNHFYDMYMQASLGQLGPEWGAWTFCSLDNPYISRRYIENKRNTMSRAAFKQEHEASFDSLGNGIFKSDNLRIADSFPGTGERVMAMDCAGFKDVETASAATKRLDETAIAMIEIDNQGNWFFKMDIGRWGIRKTTTKFLQCYRNFQPSRVGVEQGTQYNAIQPSIMEESRKYGLYFTLDELKHGNQKKAERIGWALGGRLEHGRLHYVIESEYDREMYNKFVDELDAFPSKLVHDDAPDALSYGDQLATVVHGLEEDGYVEDNFEALDEATGY